MPAAVTVSLPPVEYQAPEKVIKEESSIEEDIEAEIEEPEVEEPEVQKPIEEPVDYLPEGVICTDDCPLIEAKIRETFPEEPELAIAVARCESRLNPQAYNPHSDDGGLYQINQVHLPELEKLGLDRFDLEDNLTFARMLYERNGWQDWVCYTHDLL